MRSSRNAGGATAERAHDRRVQRTRQRLKSALLALIQERGWDRMTVDDITERADVGRSTFYTHFTSKEDLLFDGFDQHLRALAEPRPGAPAGRRFHFCLPLLRHIAEQRRFFLATIVRGNDVRIRNRSMAFITEVAALELDRLRPGRPPRIREAEAHAVAGAFLGLVLWWLGGPTTMTAEEVDRVFQSLHGEVTT